MIFVNLIAFGFIFLYSVVDSERCFNCNGITDPSNCTVVEACGPDETCSLRQFVSPDGSVLYTSTCLAKTQCDNLIHIVGRRELDERAVEITTCYECCNHDFCNNQGCGTKAVPRDQRGPYCFTCNTGLDPADCKDVSICEANEQCITFISSELSTSSQNVYTSACETKPACAALSHIYGNSSCPPTCCDQDFCNDACQNGVLTTGQPVPLVCDTAGGYQLVKDATGSVELCIKIHGGSIDWDDARAVCMADGGDLVVLDSREKGLLLRQTILDTPNHGHIAGYWIGARDFDLTNIFRWVNNQLVDLTDGDWDVGQPNHYDGGHAQNCVTMWRTSTTHFTWHDDYCAKPLSFICQQT